jgi:hypothetical protein
MAVMNSPLSKKVTDGARLTRYPARGRRNARRAYQSSP